MIGISKSVVDKLLRVSVTSEFGGYSPFYLACRLMSDTVPFPL